MPTLDVATARRGTPDRLTAASHGGAYPECDNEKSIRVVRYRFELALDRAAEITTKFMTPAAYGMPTAANACTNGLPVMSLPRWPISYHGVIISITATAKM